MKRHLVAIVILLVVLISLAGCGNGEPAKKTPSAESIADKGIDYEFTNAKGQFYSFHCNNLDATFYEKTVNELIDEWDSNVAVAESTYNKRNTYIITEGYIKSIDKYGNDYSISISQEKDGSLFSVEEISIYFYSNDARAMNALKSIKKGDYITIVCTAQDTTFFLGHPELAYEHLLEGVSLSADDGGIYPYLNLAVSDLFKQYGNDYFVDSWNTGTYIYYEDCPYCFYYGDVTNDTDRKPKETDTIYGVEALGKEAPIIGPIKTGSYLADVEAFFNQELVLAEHCDYADCSFAEIEYGGFTYDFIFRNADNLLVQASCWTDFIAPEHPDPLLEKLEVLPFWYYTEDTFNDDALKNLEYNFIQTLAYEEIYYYSLGGKTAFNWPEFDGKGSEEKHNAWCVIQEDILNYTSGGNAKYADRWEKVSDTFYQYAAGGYSGDEAALVRDINSIYSSIGDF